MRIETKHLSAIDALDLVIMAIEKQIPDIRKSGWGFTDKRCAIKNMEGLKDLCIAWKENIAMGIPLHA